MSRTRRTSTTRRTRKKGQEKASAPPKSRQKNAPSANRPTVVTRRQRREMVERGVNVFITWIHEERPWQDDYFEDKDAAAMVNCLCLLTRSFAQSVFLPGLYLDIESASTLRLVFAKVITYSASIGKSLSTAGWSNLTGLFLNKADSIQWDDELDRQGANAVALLRHLQEIVIDGGRDLASTTAERVLKWFKKAPWQLTRLRIVCEEEYGSPKTLEDRADDWQDLMDLLSGAGLKGLKMLHVVSYVSLFGDYACMEDMAGFWDEHYEDEESEWKGPTLYNYAEAEEMNEGIEGPFVERMRAILPSLVRLRLNYGCNGEQQALWRHSPEEGWSRSSDPPMRFRGGIDLFDPTPVRGKGYENGHHHCPHRHIVYERDENEGGESHTLFGCSGDVIWIRGAGTSTENKLEFRGGAAWSYERKASSESCSRV